MKKIKTKNVKINKYIQGGGRGMNRNEFKKATIKEVILLALILLFGLIYAILTPWSNNE